MTKLMLLTQHCLTHPRAGVIDAVHISKTTSAQLQARIAIVGDRQAQSHDLGSQLRPKSITPVSP